MVEDWDINPNSAFVHFAIIETVNGCGIKMIPKLSDGLPPLSVLRYAIERDFCRVSLISNPITAIYAGAQKYRPCRCDP